VPFRLRGESWGEEAFEVFGDARERRTPGGKEGVAFEGQRFSVDVPRGGKPLNAAEGAVDRGGRPIPGGANGTPPGNPFGEGSRPIPPEKADLARADTRSPAFFPIVEDPLLANPNRELRLERSSPPAVDGGLGEGLLRSRLPPPYEDSAKGSNEPR